MRKKPKTRKSLQEKPDLRFKGTANSRGYTSRWQKASKAVLRKHPICVVHQLIDPMRPVPATLVDHIRPHHGDMRVFWRRANWQVLCDPCHQAKTRLEINGWEIEWYPIPDAWYVCGLEQPATDGRYVHVHGFADSYRVAKAHNGNWWPFSHGDLATQVGELESILQAEMMNALPKTGPVGGVAAHFGT